MGTDPRRSTPRPRARRADDAGAAGRSGGRGGLPRDRITGSAGAAASPRRGRPGRRERHLERADPGRQRVGATSGPGPWLPGVHRGRPRGRHGRAGARRCDPVPGVHVSRCGARPRTDRPRGGRGRERDARPGVHLGAGSGGRRDEGTCRPGDRHPVVVRLPAAGRRAGRRGRAGDRVGGRDRHPQALPGPRLGHRGQPSGPASAGEVTRRAAAYRPGAFPARDRRRRVGGHGRTPRRAGGRPRRSVVALAPGGRRAAARGARLPRPGAHRLAVDGCGDRALRAGQGRGSCGQRRCRRRADARGRRRRSWTASSPPSATAGCSARGWTRLRPGWSR